MHAMRERVDWIKVHWRRPDVKIDPDNLEESQREMEASLGKTSDSKSATDWEDVELAIDELKALLSTPRNHA